MNRNPHAVEASLFHPDSGDEPVGGRLSVGRTQLQFQSEAISFQIPLANLEVEFEQGGKGIFISDVERPDTTIFTRDQAVLRYAEIRSRPHVAAVLSQRELTRALRLTAYFIVGCVVVIFLGSLAMSAMARAIVAKIPMSWEQKLGDQAIEKLRNNGQLLDDSNDVAQLQALAAPLIQSLPAERRDLKFYVAKSAEPNAFALPGGHVVVNVGLLQLLDEPGEVLGVLGHELAHQTKRHAIRKLVSASGPLVVFGLFLHSDSGVGNVLAAGSGLMVFQEFSRAYETEADDTGWKYLVAANIDPRGMIRAFQKLEEWQKTSGIKAFGPQALQDHPATQQRIERLQTKWEKLPRKTDFLELPPVKWTFGKPGAV